MIRQKRGVVGGAGVVLLVVVCAWVVGGWANGGREENRFLASVANAATGTRNDTGARAAVEPEWGAVQKEAVEKLSAYLKVDTSNPPGNEVRAVEWMEKVFQQEGIAYEKGESAAGRGSIVARLKATIPNPEPALVLLNHMDVVPVNQEFWTVPAFEGVVKDGYIWGRGAVDMKGHGIAQLMAFLQLKRMKVLRRRDVIFLGTADEEAGGVYGAGWVVKNRPEWFAGAGFLLNEGAQSRSGADGKVLFVGVGPTEKTPGWLKLTATGVPGHGSVPRPDSAVNKLIAALEKLRTWERPLELTAPVERALKTAAPYEPEPWRGRFANMRAFLQEPNARAELAKRPSLLALVQNTVSITGLEGTKKINIIPPVATALVDCRLLPGWTMERWTEEVKKRIGDDTIKIETVLNFPPTVSSVETDLYAAIEAGVKKVHPSAGLAQSITTGFTDSHFFREKGIVSYGFGVFAMPENDGSRAHGNDERIALAAFGDGVRLYWEVVRGFVEGK